MPSQQGTVGFDGGLVYGLANLSAFSSQCLPFLILRASLPEAAIFTRHWFPGLHLLSNCTALHNVPRSRAKGPLLFPTCRPGAPLLSLQLPSDAIPCTISLLILPCGAPSERCTLRPSRQLLSRHQPNGALPCLKVHLMNALAKCTPHQ